MKAEFLNFIDELIKHDESYANSIMTDDVRQYLDILRADKVENPEVTDNGKVILKYMQDNDIRLGKCKDIANAIGMSSRAVSGTLRKLCTDGFVEKIGKDPVVYAITEKGKNYKIN